METSRVLARIMGPLLIISALGVLLNLGSSQRMIVEFSKSASLCYLGGLMTFLMGLVILQFQNKWEAHWPVIMTFLGWLSVVKGTALILFPAFVSHLWTPLIATVPLVVSLGISLLIGVFLTIKGYWR